MSLQSMKQYIPKNCRQILSPVDISPGITIYVCHCVARLNYSHSIFGKGRQPRSGASTMHQAIIQSQKHELPYQRRATAVSHWMADIEAPQAPHHAEKPRTSTPQARVFARARLSANCVVARATSYLQGWKEHGFVLIFRDSKEEKSMMNKNFHLQTFCTESCTLEHCKMISNFRAPIWYEMLND